MSRQSEGGKARARNLSDTRRSEIARTAASARWAGEKSGQADNTLPAEDTSISRRHLNCGAALIRGALNRLPQDERKALVLTLWPDLPDRLAALIARFPDETRINGTQLQLPQSWSVISEDE
jgi:hypothetical protein